MEITPDPLRESIESWSESGRRVLELLAGLGADDWAEPTDCPGWTVREVVAHLAAIEAELAGTGPAAGIPITGLGASADYTAAGLRQRERSTSDELVADLQEAYDLRAAELADLRDGEVVRTPGGADWDAALLLRNRSVDLWVHEQDLRRALGRPGGFDGTAARVVVQVFAEAMPYVLGKKVRPLAGTTVAWSVHGPVPFELAAIVGDDGRARAVADPPTPPTATLRMHTETFAVLAAGRHVRTAVTVELGGDLALGGAVLAAMSVTP